MADYLTCSSLKMKSYNQLNKASYPVRNAKPPSMFHYSDVDRGIQMKGVRLSSPGCGFGEI
jgi:hypothetical protein